jgi:hypothetical protein
MFSDLVDMMEHKRDYCKLRFTCKCDSLNDETDPSCLECNNSATVPNTQSSNASTNHSKFIFYMSLALKFWSSNVQGSNVLGLNFEANFGATKQILTINGGTSFLFYPSYFLSILTVF